jgi:hypothetical protein
MTMSARTTQYQRRYLLFPILRFNPATPKFQPLFNHEHSLGTKAFPSNINKPDSTSNLWECQYFFSSSGLIRGEKRKVSILLEATSDFVR